MAATAAISKKPLAIGVIVFEKVMLLDYIGPTSYLELLPQVLGIPVEIHTIAAKQGLLRSTNGVPLYATTGYAEAPEKLDILLIPGGQGRRQMVKDQKFLDYIHRAAQQATHVLTVCTGSGILAHTGLLDGKRATTNKLAYNEIVSSHPAVNWVHKARWVVDGNIWTSSGVTAGMDMANAFIADQYGSDTADAMAKYMETQPNKDASNDPFAVEEHPERASKLRLFSYFLPSEQHKRRFLSSSAASEERDGIQSSQIVMAVIPCIDDTFDGHQRSYQFRGQALYFFMRVIHHSNPLSFLPKQLTREEVAFFNPVAEMSAATSAPRKVFFSRHIPYAVAGRRIILRRGDHDPRVRERAHPARGAPEAGEGLHGALLPALGSHRRGAAGPRRPVAQGGLDHVGRLQPHRHRGVQGARRARGPHARVLDVSTAETAVALTFAAKRKLLECAESAKQGQWGVWQPFQYCGTDVSDCTVGIVGLGRIGSTYARMMKFGFNCKVIYTGPREKPEFANALGDDVEFVDMDTLLKRSDIISMHLPLNDATRHAFNADCFAKMKPEAVFVNTSRGEVVDQDALYDALSTGKIAAAGIDVTTPEPLPPSHPLFSLNNCVILPHVGSATVKTRCAMADIAVQNLAAGVQGQELPHGVW